MRMRHAAEPPYLALIAARRRMFTRNPSSCVVIVWPNVFAGKLGPPELYQRYFLMPLAPATEMISLTNWVAIQDVSVGSLDGAMLFPIWSQIAAGAADAGQHQRQDSWRPVGWTWPSERTVRSTAAKPEARQASPTLTPVPYGSEFAWA